MEESGALVMDEERRDGIDGMHGMRGKARRGGDESGVGAGAEGFSVGRSVESAHARQSPRGSGCSRQCSVAVEDVYMLSAQCSVLGVPWSGFGGAAQGGGVTASAYECEAR